MRLVRIEFHLPARSLHGAISAQEYLQPFFTPDVNQHLLHLSLPFEATLDTMQSFDHLIELSVHTSVLALPHAERPYRYFLIVNNFDIISCQLLTERNVLQLCLAQHIQQLTLGILYQDLHGPKEFTLRSLQLLEAVIDRSQTISRPTTPTTSLAAARTALWQHLHHSNPAATLATAPWIIAEQSQTVGAVAMAAALPPNNSQLFTPEQEGSDAESTSLTSTSRTCVLL